MDSKATMFHDRFPNHLGRRGSIRGSICRGEVELRGGGEGITGWDHGTADEVAGEGSVVVDLRGGGGGVNIVVRGPFAPVKVKSMVG